MNTHCLPRLFVTLLLAASIVVGSEALARTPRGRDAAGVVEHLDGNAKTFQPRQSNDAKPIMLSGNSLTRFIEDADFVAAAKLREGTPVNVIYDSPFFGNKFVTKVVHTGATAIRTRTVSKRMCSRNPSPSQCRTKYP